MSPDPVAALQPPTVFDTWMAPDGVTGLVSVVVPTYNRSHYLPDLLRSVRQQTYRPIELLIVDDGSTDRTPDVVEAFADAVDPADDLAVHYHRQPNQGAPVARNRGLIASTGEFVQFADSDDILHPQKLELQSTVLREHPDLDHTWADFSVTPDEDFAAFRAEHRDEYDADVLASLDGSARVPAEVWSGLYRRSACVQIGPWNETLQRWQDVEYNSRFHLLSLDTAHVAARLYRMRSHDTGRIMDARFEAAGIDKGLHSLHVIEETLAKGDPGADPRFNIGGFYFKLVRLGLEKGRPAQIEDALRGAIAHSAHPRRGALRVLKWLYRAFGAGVTRRLLDRYVRLRTGA